MPDHDRNEWAAEAMLDEDDRIAWEQQRNIDLGLDEPRQRVFEGRHPLDGLDRQAWLRLRWVASLAVERQETGDAA
jgi:hypothetical protein